MYCAPGSEFFARGKKGAFQIMIIELQSGAIPLDAIVRIPTAT